MYPFARTYGFFGNYCWRRKIYNQLIKALPNGSVHQTALSRLGNNKIILKDGTTFIFVDPQTKSRGYRFYEAYIQKGCFNDKCEFDGKVNAKMSHGGNGVWLMDEIDDAFIWRRKMATCVDAVANDSQ